MNIGDVMRLLQFGDSLLPVGSLTFSNGLETAVHEGQVRDVAGLRGFVRTACSRAAASDGIALLEARRGACEASLPRILRADQALFNRKLNTETCAMTVRMGKKLAREAMPLSRTDQTPAHRVHRGQPACAARAGCTAQAAGMV